MVNNLQKLLNLSLISKKKIIQLILNNIIVKLVYNSFCSDRKSNSIVRNNH